MPLRSDPTVWYNLSGVVAAYQPIGAPGPLLARYNQAHGGDNRYRCEVLTLPGFAWHAGWLFTGSQVLNTGLVPVMDTKWSMLVRFDFSSGGEYPTVCGVRNGISGGQVQDFIVSADDGASGTLNKNVVRNGQGNAGYLFDPRVEGVVGFAGLTAYDNGTARGTLTSAACTNVRPMYIGAMNNSGDPRYHFIGSIQAILVVTRTLAAAEVWHVSRQMAYCHANPDWSAWGRKRRWYYAPSAAGFQAGWAAHSNAQIGTGVN